MTLQSLQDRQLDFLRRLAQELLRGGLQQLLGRHDLALGHARHRQRNSLRRLDVFAHRVQRHHLSMIEPSKQNHQPFPIIDFIRFGRSIHFWIGQPVTSSSALPHRPLT